MERTGDGDGDGGQRLEHTSTCLHTSVNMYKQVIYTCCTLCLDTAPYIANDAPTPASFATRHPRSALSAALQADSRSGRLF